jgi:FixJ family two-component response regulator
MPERHLRKEPVISIVDDDQFVRDSLKRLMKSFGYMVAAYQSAGDFLKSPRHAIVDLIMRSSPQRCPYCRSWISEEKQRE